MVISTRNKAYAPKGKFDPPRSSSSPSSSSTTAISQVPKIHESQGITLLDTHTTLRGGGGGE
jgi:hypothetical protein